MRFILTTLLFQILPFCSIGQHKEIDSLHGLLLQSKDDTVTYNRYLQLSKALYFINNDSGSSLYLKKAIDLSRKINWRIGEAKGAFILSLNEENNHVVSLSLLLTALKIFEELKDTTSIVQCLFRINIIYKYTENYLKSTEYNNRGLELAQSIQDSTWYWTLLYNNGNAYAYLNLADSALLYFQEAYRYANMTSNLLIKTITGDYPYSRNEIIGWSLHGLGRAQQLLNNDDLAINYFSKGLLAAQDQSNKTLDNDLQLSLSESFHRMKKSDSSVKFAQRCLVYALEENYVLNILGAYNILAQNYEGLNNDSAVKYFKLAAHLRNQQFSARNKADLNTLTFTEETRQREVATHNEKLKQDRNRNLQFASIGVGLISFLMISLLLSQSIVVKSGLVRFLGVIALLLVFEFINLFIHPFIADFTHHSPVWMFLVMVSIAALLVPAHHRLEKWITHQLVEKNKRIRLAAAKKTIASLEEQQ